MTCDGAEYSVYGDTLISQPVDAYHLMHFRISQLKIYPSHGEPILQKEILGSPKFYRPCSFPSPRLLFLVKLRRGVGVFMVNGGIGYDVQT